MFTSTLGSGTQGIYAGAAGSVQVVARTGDPTPTGGSYTSLGPFNPVLNGAGAVAFAPGTSPSSNSGIVVGAPGLLQTVGRVGTAAPGGGTFVTVNSPSLNASGAVAFRGTTSGGPTSAIYAGPVGSVQLVAALGDTAPGGGTFHNAFSAPRFNNAGQVAFATGSGAAGSAIYAGAPGSLQRIVTGGDAAPGGGTFGGITSSNDLSFNGSGQVAFYNSTSTTTGVFVGTAGSFQSVMRSGDAAPSGGGNTFSVLVGTAPALNGVGQVAFLADVTGAGVTAANARGLYAGSAGALEKVVRNGDVVDVDPGPGVDLRTVSAIGFAFNSSTDSVGSEDGRGLVFNDAGLITYRLTFTDTSSGVFTSQLTPVPEPAAVGLLAAAGLGVAARLRRRGGHTAGV